MTAASERPARGVRVAAVGLGGMVGTTLRYGAATSLDGAGIPWGTLLVNLVGAFALGYVLVRLRGRSVVVLLVVGTGGLGSLTTFSGLIVQTVELAGGSPGLAALYLGLSLVAGLALAVAGDRTARRRRGAAP